MSACLPQFFLSIWLDVYTLCSCVSPVITWGKEVAKPYYLAIRLLNHVIIQQSDRANQCKAYMWFKDRHERAFWDTFTSVIIILYNGF